MHCFLIASATLFAFCQALHLDETTPDTNPILTHEITNLPWGYTRLEIKDQLVLYVISEISKLEQNEPPASPRHKLIKIKDFIQYQVVIADEGLIVFTVGQLNESPPCEQINEQGQYGKCYFKLHRPYGSEVEQLVEHQCIKVPKLYITG